MTNAQRQRLRYLQPRARTYVEILDSANDPGLSAADLQRIQNRSEAVMRKMTDEEMAIATRLLSTMDREDHLHRQAR